MAESILKWLDPEKTARMASDFVEEKDVALFGVIALEGDYAALSVLSLALNMSSERFYSISKDRVWETDTIIEMLGDAIVVRGSSIKPETNIVIELAAITAQFLGSPLVLQEVNLDVLDALNSKMDEFRYELLEGSSLIELLDKFIETSDLAEKELCVR